jgi:3-methyl-2-oxobutanoate hydroxymethyltransferase
MDAQITIADLVAAKKDGRPIVAVSCYDYLTAKLVAQTDIHMILVGDSAAMVVLGHDSTLHATMDYMVAITAAVRRGAPKSFLVADMPFLSYQLGIKDAVRNAARFITEAGAQMVKIEVSQACLDVIKTVTDAGIAVMAHIGIRPQTVAKMGKLKAEGTTAEMALELMDLAQQAIHFGADALLLEGAAAEVADIITKQVDVPVISCGSGPACDGQILIAPDILGLGQGPLPKFAKKFGRVAEETIAALAEYARQVHARQFPDSDHSYHMKKGEFERLQTLLGNMPR